MTAIRPTQGCGSLGVADGKENPAVTTTVADKLAQFDMVVAQILALLTPTVPVTEPVRQVEEPAGPIPAPTVEAEPAVIPKPASVPAEPAAPAVTAAAKAGPFRAVFDRAELLAAIGKAMGAVSARSPLPVLLGVKVEGSSGAVDITGSDLDTTVVATVKLVAVDGKMRIVLPGKLFQVTVKGMSGDTVSVESAGDDQAKVGVSVLRTMPADDYPKITMLPQGASTLNLTADEGLALRQGLEAVLPASSTDNSRPLLCSVAFESADGGLRLVATDSYRLHLADTLIPFAQEQQRPAYEKGEWEPLPVRREGLTRMVKMMEPRWVTFGPREVMFCDGDSRIQMRIEEGRFPNYRQLLPGIDGNAWTAAEGYPVQVTGDRAGFVTAFKQLKPIVQDHIPVHFTATDGSLILSGSKQDTGQTAVPVEAQVTGGEGFLSAYNLRYMAEAIAAGYTGKAAERGGVRISILDPLKPAIVTTDSRPGWLGLLMPVRI